MRNQLWKTILVFAIMLILLCTSFPTVCFAENEAWTDEVNLLFEKQKHLSELVLECENKGISVAYEKIDVYLVEKFIGRVLEDINNLDEGGENTLNRISYTVDALNEMCDRTIDLCAQYLNQTASPKEVVYSDAFQKFNIGYLTGEIGVNIDNLKNLGANYSVVAISMRDVIKEAGAPSGFTVVKSELGQDVSYKQTFQNSNNKILTISAQSVKTGEDYMYQNVSLEPNTEYEFGGKVFNDVKYAGYIALRKTEVIGEKIDIIKTGSNVYTQTFTTGDTAGLYQFRIGLNASNLADISFDDVFVRKVGDTENLLMNSGFENCVTDYQTEYGSGGIDYDVLSSYQLFFEMAEEQNIRLGLMLNLHEYPSFLQKRNSKCMKKFSTYVPYNISETRIRSDIGVFVKTVASIFRGYDSLESVCLLNEPEYDTRLDVEYYQQPWSDYLKSVHGDVNMMNIAYGGTTFSSFEEVAMPLDETCGGVFYDWKNFNEDILVDYMSYLRDCVKSVSDIPVCYKVMLSNGYIDIEGFVQRGNTALEKFAEISDYFGCDAYATYTKNQPLLGKMMVYDLAYSMGSKPIINAEDHVISDWVNYQDTGKCYDPFNAPFIGADVWLGSLHARQSSALWTLRISNLESHYAYNSLGVHPDILSAIGERSMDVMRLSEEVQKFSNRDAEIAIIYSDASRSYRREYMNAVYNAYCASYYSGKKVEFVTENQIKDNLVDLKNYKLIIVASAQHVYNSTVEALKNYTENGGRLMIFDRQSLMYNEYDCSSANRSRLVEEIHQTDNTTVREISFENYKMVEDISEEIYTAVLEQFEDNYALFDTNGNRVSVAYDITSYNGYVYINLYNTTSETMDLSVLEDGIIREECYDVLNNKEITDGIIKLEPYGVALLQIEREPIKVIGDVSMKNMQIKGYGHIPNALVSVLVVKPGAKEEVLPFSGDILYMNEKNCNNAGEFSFDVTFRELIEGSYQIYAQVKNEENKLIDAYQYEFFVPKIMVMQGETPVTSMKQLSQGDTISINIEIINEDKRDFNGILYCAYYENNVLNNVVSYTVDGDKTKNQTVMNTYTIEKVGEGGTLKLMFWERGSIRPFVSAYVIE